MPVRGESATIPRMSLMRLFETTPGKFSLLLDAGTTPVDGLVQELGHEPNGYFWEGVARFLVSTRAPALEARFRYDSEAGMFCAYGDDEKALGDLSELMSAVVSDPDRLRATVASAEAAGFEFDD